MQAGGRAGGWVVERLGRREKQTDGRGRVSKRAGRCSRRRGGWAGGRGEGRSQRHNRIMVTHARTPRAAGGGHGRRATVGGVVTVEWVQVHGSGGAAPAVAPLSDPPPGVLGGGGRDGRSEQRQERSVCG